jgi:alpha-methylacyl-CoA racemase
MGPGPLNGVKVLEFAGIGPGPFCGMLLADLGADVVRIDRPSAGFRVGPDITGRGKRSIVVDLKNPEGIEAALALIERADVLLEGFRPGVMERLGLGPEPVHARNPALVYGRMTGWGQSGPWSPMAGHDINYIALTGALHAMGRADDTPPPPLNLVGDYGGGALYLAFGVCAALVERGRSGKGQVIDCAMVDGAASLMSMFYGMRAAGVWRDARDANLLDGGAHFYDTYACRDGGWLAVGAIEPEFHKVLVEGLGLSEEEFPGRMDPANWPKYSNRIADVIRTRTRDEWMTVFEGTDACVAPVLSMEEAPRHPHMAARGALQSVNGVVQPGPAPRFSRTPGAVGAAAPEPGRDTRSVLADWAISDAEGLASRGVVRAV